MIVCINYRNSIIEIQHNTKQINIKNRPCYLLNELINDVINIENFNRGLLEISKLLFKGVFTVDVYYIKYITMKSPDHVNIDDDEDFLYLI